MNELLLGKKEVNILNELKDIFENTNRWLAFAESKNGVLLGVNGLFLFKMLDWLNGVEDSILNTKMIWILLIIFISTTLLILKSFFPNCSSFIDKEIDTCKESNGYSRILIFYEDISKYESSKIYLMDIYKYYFKVDVDLKELTKHELDYAKEILINSRIASYKYKCFKWALKFNGFGILLLVLFHLIS